MSWFLRERSGRVERAWHRDQFGARDKERALRVLGDSVVVVRHPYERHPGSGAGNCWCGRDRSATLHRGIVMEPA